MQKTIEKYIILSQERPDEFVGSENGRIVFDPKIMEREAKRKGRPLGVVYESPYHIVVVDLLQDQNNNYLFYERVLNTIQNPSVVIIPIYEEKFVLLYQYRHALQDMQYAFPRGFGEIGLSAEENARKELREELGCEAKKLRCLNSIVADSGLCGHAVQVVVTWIDSFEKKKNYEGIVDSVLLSREEMIQWINEGKINDSFTISAFCEYNII